MSSQTLPLRPSVLGKSLHDSRVDAGCPHAIEKHAERRTAPGKNIYLLKKAGPVMHQQILERTCGKYLKVAICWIVRNARKNLENGVQAERWVATRQVIVQVVLIAVTRRHARPGPLLYPAGCDIGG